METVVNDSNAAVQLIILLIGIFQPIIMVLTGWLLVTIFNLNREIGKMCNTIENVNDKVELAHQRITELKREVA